METRRHVDREVERGLGSVGKLKILRLLLEKPDQAFTRYAIGQKVSNDPASIRSDLNTLVEINWVNEFKVQHLSKYSINLDKDVVRQLAIFFQELRHIP
jgi:Fe2+ or Zn2+ uptake regulation protein